MGLRQEPIPIGVEPPCLCCGRHYSPLPCPPLSPSPTLRRSHRANKPRRPIATPWSFRERLCEAPGKGRPPATLSGASSRSPFEGAFQGPLPVVLLARVVYPEIIDLSGLDIIAMGAPFPFTAIVGQDDMKLALLIAAVDPRIGGVLAFGDRGAGKSTAVRALAALLPPIQAVKGCAYRREARSGACAPGCAVCDGQQAMHTEWIPTPVVDMPLGATEDRVVGALNLERALTRGEKAFEPGLLAAAHRGFLYIDEVNLLEDHLVDLLLDVAASGENIVERDGISVRHPAQFVLVGSGNPEEGELRPQLLDRFGLSVEVKSPESLEQRVTVVRRRDAFDRDPLGFVAAAAEAEESLRNQIIKARDACAAVTTPDSLLEDGARLCMAVGADGMRGELTLLRASRAKAALEGRDMVGRGDLRAIAAMTLRHRLRRNPLDETGSTVRIERAMAELFSA